MWVSFYNLHKMYAGLRDAWVYCGNEQAKQLFLGFCDWAIDLTAGLSDAQMERTLDTEHGGMNEVLADAYAITGDTNDVFFRDARDGHYFSYLMQTGGETDLSLRLKYWGVGEWRTHEFDIFVDDVLVTSVNNTGKYRISEFKYETYPIPAEALKGKKQVRVKFVAHPRKQVGEIYGVRLVKP